MERVPLFLFPFGLFGTHFCVTKNRWWGKKRDAFALCLESETTAALRFFGMRRRATVLLFFVVFVLLLFVLLLFEKKRDDALPRDAGEG